ncbi:hypothetical protein M885DRAFT_613576 [Pelagophyceae sp. CCMP2097]|nr:hypothetical protein M885DRAFT_613576 [Pelagophyceae sp. CCMP2097]
MACSLGLLLSAALTHTTDSEPETTPKKMVDEACFEDFDDDDTVFDCGAPDGLRPPRGLRAVVSFDESDDMRHASIEADGDMDCSGLEDTQATGHGDAEVETLRLDHGVVTSDGGESVPKRKRDGDCIDCLLSCLEGTHPLQNTGDFDGPIAPPSLSLAALAPASRSYKSRSARAAGAKKDSNVCPIEVRKIPGGTWREFSSQMEAARFYGIAQAFSNLLYGKASKSLREKYEARKQPRKATQSAAPAAHPAPAAAPAATAADAGAEAEEREAVLLRKRLERRAKDALRRQREADRKREVALRKKGKPQPPPPPSPLILPNGDRQRTQSGQAVKPFCPATDVAVLTSPMPRRAGVAAPSPALHALWERPARPSQGAFLRSMTPPLTEAEKERAAKRAERVVEDCRPGSKIAAPERYHATHTPEHIALLLDRPLATVLAWYYEAEAVDGGEHFATVAPTPNATNVCDALTALGVRETVLTDVKTALGVRRATHATRA